jgi:hypothetical protein
MGATALSARARLPANETQKNYRVEFDIPPAMPRI